VSSTTSDSFCIVNHLGNETNDLNIFEQQVVQAIQTKHSQIQTSLPFRTDIRGQIRTLNENAIYSRQYPYHHSVNHFGNQEINGMLNEEFIRSSRSPYNAPVWVVEKKGINEDETQKNHLVIDFKKLNENTIPDNAWFYGNII